MWIHLTDLVLGDYNYQVISQEINSPQIRLIFNDSLPSTYQANYMDLIVIAREFSDGSTESCGVIYPQHPQMIFQFPLIPVGFSDFKIKFKKIPRRGYGISRSMIVEYWQ